MKSSGINIQVRLRAAAAAVGIGWARLYYLILVKAFHFGCPVAFCLVWFDLIIVDVSLVSINCSMLE